MLFIFVQSIKKADRQNAIRFFIELLAKELKERLQHVTNVYQRSAKELHVCISETNKNSQAQDCSENSAENPNKEKEEQAKQTVIEAQAEADSNRLIADSEAYAIEKIQEALEKNPQYIELEKIKKWDGKLPQAMGNEINPFVSLGE